MKRPPLFLRLRIHGEKRRPGCWLPLFILLPLAVALLIVLSPLILLAAIILRRRERRNRKVQLAGIVLRMLFSPGGIRAGFGLLCSTPGLRIDVSDNDGVFQISVI